VSGSHRIDERARLMREFAADGLENCKIMMVFEYMDYDLAGLMHHDEIKLTEPYIQSYLYQLLEGALLMHRNHVIHRDIKGTVEGRSSTLFVSITCLQAQTFL
jgi:serine/threonine protein kinase